MAVSYDCVAMTRKGTNVMRGTVPKKKVIDLRKMVSISPCSKEWLQNLVSLPLEVSWRQNLIFHESGDRKSVV